MPSCCMFYPNVFATTMLWLSCFCDENSKQLSSNRSLLITSHTVLEYLITAPTMVQINAKNKQTNKKPKNKNQIWVVFLQGCNELSGQGFGSRKAAGVALGEQSKGLSSCHTAFLATSRVAPPLAKAQPSAKQITYLRQDKKHRAPFVRVRKIRDKSADTKTRGGRAGGYSQAPEQRFPCILWRSTGWMCPDGGCSLWGTHKGAWRTKAGAVCSWRTASHRMDSSWSSSGRTAARGKDLYWKLIKDCIYGSGTMLEQRNIVWDRRSGTDGALQSDHSLPFPIVMVSRVGGDRRARKGMKLSLGRRGTVWG